MGTINLKDFFLSSRIRHILISLCAFLVVYLILITALVTKTYDLKEGDIAKLSIKAQRNITDEVSTEAKKEEAIRLVPPQYSIKSEIKINAVDKVTSLFTLAAQIRDSNAIPADKVKQLKSGCKIALSDDDINTLLNMNKDEAVTLEQFLKGSLSDIYDMGIQYNGELSVEINTESLKKAQDMLQMKFNTMAFSKNARDLGLNTGLRLIEANSFYDKLKTEEAKNEAINKTAPVIVKKDQIIVMEGDQVTKQKYELLKNLGLLNTNTKSEWYVYISLGILTCMLLLIQNYYLYKYHKDIYEDISKFLLINIINCASLALARVLSLASPFLIPLAFGPMIMSLLINHKISLSLGVLNSIFISCAVNFSIEATILAVISSLTGALVIRKLQQRNDVLYSCLFIAVVNLLVTISVGFLLTNNTVEVLYRALFSLVGSSLSGILTIGLLPAFESAFDIVTTIKLLELSNPNNTLLKKLLIEAPGTYHHSILVANLAEVAAEAVGGNPVLARVCSYYHDVGKIKRPYFFKENQIGNENPHNKITPNLSALIIISHIKDGLELARESRLPKVIQDVIEQHHGNSLVKYFYITAKNSSDAPDEIEQEDFMYPGPIPSTKEAAIIMLADSIEASVRSISDHTQSKIEEMVNNIIKDRLNSGQLDDCDLTLKDLSTIKQAFIKSLNGIYHQRIEYPVDKWELKEPKNIESN